MNRHSKGPPPLEALHAARAALAEAEADAKREVKDIWGLPFDKSALQRALCEEQRYLCAYCGRTIQANGQHMIVEHFTPRSKDPTLTFDWQNLLGVCTGHSSLGSEDFLHCDQHRTTYNPLSGKGLLHHKPTELELWTLAPFEMELKGATPYDLRLTTTKAIEECKSPVRGRYKTEAGSHQAHDVRELNLNAPPLVQARANALLDLGRALERAGQGGAPKLIGARIQAIQRSRRGDKLPPYAHVEIVYLLKKQRAYGP